MGLTPVEEDRIMVLAHEREDGNESVLVWLWEMRLGKKEGLEKRGIVCRD